MKDDVIDVISRFQVLEWPRLNQLEVNVTLVASSINCLKAYEDIISFRSFAGFISGSSRSQFKSPMMIISQFVDIPAAKYFQTFRGG